MPRFTPGMFTGERSILTGGRFLGRISATVPTDVIEVERDELLKLIQTDTELSDIFLRTFILRRLQLIDRGYGDVVVLGSEHCSGTLHIREFLTRNGHPFTQRDLDTDAESQELLDRELPRLPARHLGSGAGIACLRSGAEIRRPRVDREARDATRLRPEALPGAA